jgi:excisionase family DNA binding protein
MAAENPERLNENPERLDERLNEDLWSIERTAKFLDVEKGTLYQWASQGRELRSYKVGNARKYDPADVRAYLREHASEPAA